MTQGAHLQLGGSIRWAFLGNVANQAIQFGVFIALARMLNASEFGLAVEAALVVDVLAALSTAGIPAALVRKPHLVDTDTTAGFWTHLGFGALAWSLAALAAPLAATLFHQPALAPLLIVLALNLVIAPLGAVHVALIERDLGFRSLALRTLGANLAGGGVGVLGALWGLGAWALVLRSVAAALATVVVVWIAHPWRPRLSYDRAAGRALLGQGSRLAGAELVSQLNGRGLELVAGLLISPASVGVLRVAGRLFGLLSQLTLGPVAMVALPTLAKVQEDVPARDQAYRELSALSGALVFPVFIGAAAVADVAVPLIFGPKWALSALVTPALCALILPLLFNVLFWASLAASGRASTALKWNVLQLAVGLPLAALAAPSGLAALVTVTIARSYAMMPFGLHILRRRLGLRTLDTLRPMAPALAAAAVMGLVVFAGRLLLADRLAGPWMLALLVVAGATLYAALLQILAPGLVRALLGRVRRRG